MVNASEPSTHATFTFFDPANLKLGIKPWTKVDVKDDPPVFKQVDIDLPVYDARADAEDFRDVDRTGFAFHTFPSAVDHEAVLANGPEVIASYYPEIEASLRAKLANGSKVKKIILFDHTIRVRNPDAARQPVRMVHVDQTPAAAATRVRRHAPADEVESLLKGRYQIINVWRPLGHKAQDMPLGVIDWRTASKDNLVAMDLLYPIRPEGDDGDDRHKEVKPAAETIGSTEGYEVKGETYNVTHHPAQRLYYVKDMGPDEVMFLKCFDSRSQDQPGGREGVAGFTPHTAFIDENAAADAKPRQSIEVRALVFYDE